MTALKATPYQGRCFTPLKLIPTLKAAQRGAARAAAAAVGVPPRSLDQCQAWDLLSCHTAGGGQEFLEVLEGWDGSCAKVLWKGQQLRAAADGSLPAGTWRLTPLGGWMMSARQAHKPRRPHARQPGTVLISSDVAGLHRPGSFALHTSGFLPAHTMYLAPTSLTCRCRRLPFPGQPGGEVVP
jgi:hypothetical protein